MGRRTRRGVACRRRRPKSVGGLLVSALCVGVIGLLLLGPGWSGGAPAPGRHPSPGAARLGDSGRTASAGTLGAASGESPIARSVTSNSSGWLQWNNSTVYPAARYGGTLATDPNESGVVLFGGVGASGIQYTNLNDTWVYRNGSWVELCTGTSAAPACGSSPPAGENVSMTFDPAAGGLLLFGIYQSLLMRELNQTWLLRNGTWTNLTATAGRAPGAGGWMTYDAADRLVLLFTPGETWSFANGSWSRMYPSVEPSSSPSFAGTMFYDAAMGAVILWDGSSGTTWEFHGGEWTRLEPLTSPPAGGPLGGAYDTAFGYGVVFGPKGTTDNSTWLFANGTWENATSALGPAPAFGPVGLEGSPGFAYDGSSGYFVLLDEQWFPVDTGTPSVNQTWVLHDPVRAVVLGPEPAQDVGQRVEYAVTIVGGVPPYTIGIPTVPAGCSVPANLTAAFAVSCELDVLGGYWFNLSVSDRLGEQVALEIPLTVNPDPLALMVVTPNPSTVGIPVALEGGASGGTRPYRVNWSVEGQPSSNLTVEEVTFSVPGTYAANFSVTDAAGWTVYRAISLVIHAAPQPAIRLSRTVTDAGLPVELSAAATGGTGALSYSWEFGDGARASTNDTTHVYVQPGRYEIELWGNDSVGAVGTAYANLTVNPALAEAVVANASHVSPGGAVGFAGTVAGGTPPYTYWWEFGDGGSNHSANATHVYSAVGNYTAVLVVNDSVGGSRSDSVAVQVVASSSGLPPTNTTLPPTSGGAPWEYALGGGAVVLGAVVAVALVVRVRRGRGGATATEPPNVG